ncbi:MAG TPA: NAD(P)-dependent oxidoreductase [Polyangia bacterium]
MSAQPRIGFLGLGIMGGPMAHRLLSAGFETAVYTRGLASAPERKIPFLDAGARVCETPAEAAAGADVILSVVTDSPDVEAVLLGEHGAAAGARPGALFIDMSTIDPAAARAISGRLVARGMRFLDAPVTGGDVGARTGALSILVGGDAADLDRARPVFDVLGKRITHCGPVGAGQAMKACNQILCALNMIGVVEAMHLAEANGLDRTQLVEALSAGAGGSWALEKLGPRIAAADFAPGFMVRLIQKDLRIVQNMAAEAGLPLDGTALAQRNFADNEANDEAALGTQAMWKVLARRRGK